MRFEKAVPGGVGKQSLETFAWRTAVGENAGAHKVWEAATTVGWTGTCKGVQEAAMSDHLAPEE